MFRIVTSRIGKNVVKSNLIQRHQLSTGKNQFRSNPFNRSAMIGVGAVTFGSLFAYNQVNAASGSTADFKKVREDITALLDDENAKKFERSSRKRTSCRRALSRRLPPTRSRQLGIAGNPSVLP